MELHKRQKPQENIATSEQVSLFLTKSGFILEMEISELLIEQGYSVEVNKYFHDYDENKKREIDIVATKIIDEIKVVLVIECKQSSETDWIFICSDRNPSRHYEYVKCQPSLQYSKGSSGTKIFNHLHTLDHKIQIAKNHIIRKVDDKIDTNKDVIYECLTKLPKALVHEAEELTKMKRTIFLPIAVFSRQFFKAEYNGKLNVTAVNFIQYPINLDTPAYTYLYKPPSRPYKSLIGEEDSYYKDHVNTPVAETCRRLGKQYLVNFVTKKGLEDYFSKIDDEIKGIDESLWPIA